jgi:hypothetical protein
MNTIGGGLTKKKGRTIWVSDNEYAMISESKELFRMMTGVKISWGAYITALSLGAIAAKSLSGLLIRCPNCRHEVEMVLVKPKLKY